MVRMWQYILKLTTPLPNESPIAGVLRYKAELGREGGVVRGCECPASECPREAPTVHDDAQLSRRGVKLSCFVSLPSYYYPAALRYSYVSELCFSITAVLCINLDLSEGRQSWAAAVGPKRAPAMWTDWHMHNAVVLYCCTRAVHLELHGTKRWRCQKYHTAVSVAGFSLSFLCYVRARIICACYIHVFQECFTAFGLSLTWLVVGPPSYASGKSCPHARPRKRRIRSVYPTFAHIPYPPCAPVVRL